MYTMCPSTNFSYQPCPRLYHASMIWFFPFNQYLCILSLLPVLMSCECYYGNTRGYAPSSTYPIMPLASWAIFPPWSLFLLDSSGPMNYYQINKMEKTTDLSYVCQCTSWTNDARNEHVALLRTSSFKALGFPGWWLVVNTMIQISSGFTIHC